MNAARSQIDDLAISTDVIVGFPGETDEEFAISREFIEQMNFMKLHVFRYSRRPGTVAAKMKGQVPEAIKKQRSAALLALSDQAMARFHDGFVGREIDVLWEHVSGSSQDGYVNSGLTDNYIRVETTHPEVLTNQVTRVRAVSSGEGGVVAELLRNPAVR